MATILVAEDDANIRRLIRDHLVKEGYYVFDSKDGVDALNLVGSHHVDLLITDVMMPTVDGLELARRIRAAGYEFPILLITALDTLNDMNKGFSGWNDYMAKPVDMEEMMERVESLLRSARILSSNVLVIGKTVLNRTRLNVTAGNIELELSTREFQLLHKLLSHPRKIFTRKQLMYEISGYGVHCSECTVDVYINRLTEKLSGIKDFKIVSVCGLGFKAEESAT